MTEVVNAILEPKTLPQLQRDSGLSQQREDQVHVLHVLLGRLREDDYVVEVNQARLPSDSREDYVQRTLECCRRISKAKRHASVSVSTAMTSKCRLVSVLRSDRYLPVARIGVEGGEDHRFPEAVNALVNPW